MSLRRNLQSHLMRHLGRPLLRFLEKKKNQETRSRRIMYKESRKPRDPLKAKSRDLQTTLTK